MRSFKKVVTKGYTRLVNDSRGWVDGSEKIFHEWASGHVLLDVGETREASSAVADGDVSMLLSHIHNELKQLGEQRLVPVLGTAKHSTSDHVIYVLLPLS